MHFLKRNKFLIVLVVMLIFTFYLDKPVLAWIKNFYTSNPGAERLDHALRQPIRILSHGTTLFALSLCLYFFGGSVNRALRETGKILFLGLISAGVSVQILKHLIGRARPSVTYDSVFIGPSVKYAYDSFPSGHTASVFCAAYILSEFFPRYRALAYLFGVVVGIYRVDALSHFPSDVIGGALLGLGVGKFIWMKTSGRTRRMPEGIGTDTR